MGWISRLRDRARRRPRPQPAPERESALETPQERRERWLSIRVIYFTMFLMSLGFSIVLTGVWPYLDKLDPAAGKEFMGYVVGANPLGQMLFSPLFGWWGNRIKSVRLPLLFSLALFTLASGIYSTLEAFTTYRKYWMLGARFLVGVSSANIAVCRSYLSAATTLRERTDAVSKVSLAQVLGFIVGPVLQAAVTRMDKDEVEILSGYIKLNMYTVPGWINVVMSILNFIMFLPFIFVERPIASREAMLNQGAESEEATWRHNHPDYVSTWTLICAFFVLVFNFVLLETLGTPLTMDQFAWSKTESLYYMGIVMAVGGVIACVTFLIIGPLCKRFPERRVLLWGGFFLMVVGRALYIPWGSTPLQIAEVGENNMYVPNETLLANETGESIQNETEVLGCPSTQEWCYYTPAMTITQFIIGYALTAVGYPIGVTLIQTIFSKILGPRPQGVWMGLMTGSGCLSRVMGPVFVSYIYTRLGTIWTFSITAVMMALSMVWLQIVDRKLIVPEENSRTIELQTVIKASDDADVTRPLQEKEEDVRTGNETANMSIANGSQTHT